MRELHRSRVDSPQFRFQAEMAESQRTSVFIMTKLFLAEEVGGNGVFMALDRMVVAEGGFDNPAACQRAVAYATECVKRLAPFLKWHPVKQTAMCS